MAAFVESSIPITIGEELELDVTTSDHGVILNGSQISSEENGCLFQRDVSSSKPGRYRGGCDERAQSEEAREVEQREGGGPFCGLRFMHLSGRC